MLNYRFLRGEKTSDKTPSVAIVDDENAIVDVLKMVLARHAIPIVFTANDGDVAVELFKKANPKPDIILMDHRMLKMDGLEAMKQILNIDPHIKIIFISADGHMESEALNAGAKLFITKPASLNTILKGIEITQNPDEPSVDRKNTDFKGFTLKTSAI